MFIMKTKAYSSRVFTQLLRWRSLHKPQSYTISLLSVSCIDHLSKDSLIMTHVKKKKAPRPFLYRTRTRMSPHIRMNFVNSFELDFGAGALLLQAGRPVQWRGKMVAFDLLRPPQRTFPYPATSPVPDCDVIRVLSHGKCQR
jgi:hypothetical protein